MSKREYDSSIALELNGLTRMKSMNRQSKEGLQ